MDLKELVVNALSEVLPEEISHDDLHALVDVPRDASFGDFSLPCFKLVRYLNRDPKDIALLLKGQLEQLELDSSKIEKIDVVGPYLNFFVNKSSFAKGIIQEVLVKDFVYGTNLDGKGEKIMVEFSSPNTNKPLHIGHVRNNSIGSAISNLYKSNGFDVIRASIINDRGIHVCKSML
ncbi:MAG: arginine--tRNA ligase, partial [Candidatus Diapherotrites archaeon]|nr:arginine--tRNA ligase [Candidatus Diapherotrites archaeon]